MKSNQNYKPLKTPSYLLYLAFMAAFALAALYFRDLLSFTIGEQPGIARKPAPDMLRLAAETLGVALSRCLYVGDTEVDIQTAENTGIDCVCVTWGFRTREALARAGATRIAASAEELLRLIL